MKMKKCVGQFKIVMSLSNAIVLCDAAQSVEQHHHNLSLKK